jgi:hypothetical protein
MTCSAHILTVATTGNVAGPILPTAILDTKEHNYWYLK